MIHYNRDELYKYLSGLTDEGIPVALVEKLYALRVTGQVLYNLTQDKKKSSWPESCEWLGCTLEDLFEIISILPATKAATEAAKKTTLHNSKFRLRELAKIANGKIAYFDQNPTLEIRAWEPSQVLSIYQRCKKSLPFIPPKAFIKDPTFQILLDSIQVFFRLSTSSAKLLLGRV